MVSLVETGESKICVKEFRYPHWFDRLKENFRTSKGLRAWIAGNGLKIRNVPCLGVLAYVEKKNGLGIKESFLLMEASEKGQEMDRYLFKGFQTAQIKRLFVRTFAQWLSRLHQKEIFHRDMKACNILVSEEGGDWRFELLDLEDVRLDQKVEDKEVFRTLLQLNTSIPKRDHPHGPHEVLQGVLSPSSGDSRQEDFSIQAHAEEQGKGSRLRLPPGSGRGKMGLNDPIEKASKWSHGAVPLARNETHDKVVEMMEKEPRGRVLDVPTGTGVLAGRLKGMGFELSCCDINASYFSIPDLSIELGDLNQSPSLCRLSFDYVICLDGIEHTENPSTRFVNSGGC